MSCIATGGTFTLTFRGETTSPIDWDAHGTDDFLAVTGLGTVTLTHMASTFTMSNNVASTITAGYYMIISGSSDLTSPDTDVRYVHISSSSWGGASTTATMTELYGGGSKASSSDITLKKYKMSMKSALEVRCPASRRGVGGGGGPCLVVRSHIDRVIITLGFNAAQLIFSADTTLC